MLLQKPNELNETFFFWKLSSIVNIFLKFETDKVVLTEFET